jgi:hypothetical protein
MQAAEVLRESRARGIELFVEGDALRYRAPRGALTAELRAALADHKAELLVRLRCSNAPKMLTHGCEHLNALAEHLSADSGELAAVLLRRTLLGDVWLVADTGALADHPDIIRSGLPVFFFEEISRLRGKTAAELRAVGILKAKFPTGRVLQ